MGAMIKEWSKSEVRSRRVLRGALIAVLCIFLVLILIRVAPLSHRVVILPIRKVQIYGNHHVSKGEIVQRMGIDTSTSILTLSKGSVRNSLFDDKRIDHVEMAKLYPDTLRVFIRERGALSIMCVKDTDYWVSGDGVVMSETTQKAVVESYPRITLKSKNDDIKIGERVGDLQVLDTLAALEGIRKEYPDFFGQLSSFTVGADGVRVHLDEELFSVWLGSNVTKEKLESLRALLIVLKSEKSGPLGESLPGGRVEIDLSSTHAAVRMRESDYEP